jgi:hypothetical protein
MKNTFLLRKEFKEWLISIAKLPLPTVNSYLSYVAGVDKKFEINHERFDSLTNLFEILKVLVDDEDDFGMDNTIISIINELHKKDIDKILETPINTIRNWRSGLFQYREFLYYFIETNIKPTVDENEIFEDYSFEDTEDDEVTTINLIDDENDYNYSKTDLYKIFNLRIITQDRFYNHIYYPISFIKRFLYLNGEKQFLDNWVQNLLDNIDVHLENEKIKLKEVVELSITNKRVFVKHNKSTKIVLTRLSDNQTLAYFEVDLLKKIAIDHEKPLFNIMTENINMLDTINKITIELKKHIKGTPNPSKLKKANNALLQSECIDLFNIENLKKELEFLSSKTNLQLMDSRQNLIKKTAYN